MTDLVTRLRQVFAGRSDVRLALLFGSQSRGLADPRSDVDLAVDAPTVDRLALAATVSLTLGMEVDIVALDDPGVPLLEELVRDGVVIHEGAPGAAAQWRSHTLAQLETDRPWYERMSRAWLARVAERGL